MARIVNFGTPAVAIICYLLLLSLFRNTKKDKLIGTFCTYTISMTIWAFFSFMMRVQRQNAPTWNFIMINFIILSTTLLYFLTTEYLRLKQRKTKIMFIFITVILIFINLKGDVISNVTCDADGFVRYNIKYGIIVISAYAIFTVMVCGFNLLYCYRNHKLKMVPVKWPALSIVFVCLASAANIIGEIGKYPVDIFCSMLSSIIISYAILNYRFLNVQFLIKKRMYSWLITVTTTVLYFLIFLAVTQIVSALWNTEDSALEVSILTAVLVALSTRPINTGLNKLYNQWFKRENYRKMIIDKFNSHVVNVLDLNELSDLIIDTVYTCMECGEMYLYIKQIQTDSFSLAKSKNGTESLSIALTSEHAIVRWFANGNKLLNTHDLEILPFFKTVWNEEKQKIKRANLDIILPVKIKNDIIGLLMITRSKNEKNYNTEDIDAVISMLGTAGVILENANLYEKAKIEAITDGLTNLFNIRHYHQTLRNLIEVQRIETLTLLMGDIDYFKVYNDLNGHARGDEALIAIADIISRSLADVPDALAFRYGGEEFTVILPHMDSTQALVYAERIRTNIELYYNEVENEFGQRILTMSIGIASYPANAKTVSEISSFADIALYLAKKQGRNRCICYNSQENSWIEGSADKNTDPSNEYYSPIISSLYSLVAAIDAKDHYTFYHSRNVATYGSSLGKKIGLDFYHCEIIYQAGLVHDIGKIGIPEHILAKTQMLTDEEYNHIKKHVTNSVNILKYSPALRRLIPAVFCHHEKWDGTGYPRGLSGEKIPIEARCIAIADSFDSMVTDRPYRPGMPVEDALRELKRGRGTQFDGELTDIFVDMVRNHEIKLNLEKINYSQKFDFSHA